MISKTIAKFSNTLYRLNLPGYDNNVGDEKHDIFAYHLYNYWECVLVGRPPRL